MGFVGVIVLLQPGSDAFSPWVFLPLCGAVFYALTHIITRTKCASTPLPIMAMSLNTVMLTAGALMSCVVLVWQPDETLVRAYPNVLGSWSPMGAKDWLILGVLSAFVIVITLLLTGAYQVAPPSTVATFEYCYLVFVAIWDLLFFATSPSVATVVGMGLIVSAGLMVLRRE